MKECSLATLADESERLERLILLAKFSGPGQVCQENEAPVRIPEKSISKSRKVKWTSPF